MILKIPFSTVSHLYQTNEDFVKKLPEDVKIHIKKVTQTKNDLQSLMESLPAFLTYDSIKDELMYTGFSNFVKQILSYGIVDLFDGDTTACDLLTGITRKVHYLHKNLKDTFVVADPNDMLVSAVNEYKQLNQLIIVCFEGQ